MSIGKYAFGADIGGTSVKIGLMETAGKLIQTWEIPTDTFDNGRRILKDIALSIQQTAEGLSLPKQEIEGIGLAVPGPVREDGVVNRCLNLGWGVFNAAEELASLTGMRVKAVNDGHAAALGEMWLGSAQGCQSVVMLTLGTGIGGGVVSNGQVVFGHHGAGGELGHIHVRDGEQEPCVCGNHGCLEQYASAKGLVYETRRYLAALPQDRRGASSLGAREGFSARDVVDAAKSGDEIALKMLQALADVLGKGLSIIACVADPERLIIGGGLSRAGDILMDLVRSAYRENAFHAMRDTPIETASLGNLAGVCGAVKLLVSG